MLFVVMIRTPLHEVVLLLLRDFAVVATTTKIAPAPTKMRARGREFERQGARMRVGACRPSVGL